MLYNPAKWDRKETVHDPLTLEALIAWLEKQPGEKKYFYRDIGACLAAQYNLSIGRKYNPPGILYIYANPSEFDARIERIGLLKPHTFSAALQRARTMLGERG